MYKNDAMTSEAMDRITEFSDEVSDILARMVADIAHARQGKSTEESALIELEDVETLRRRIMEKLA